MSIFYVITLTIYSTWHFEPIPDAINTRIAIDVDTSITPHIGYWKNNTIYYAKRITAGDSSIWLSEIVDTTPIGPFIWHTNFAVGKNSRPHIVYHKRDNSPHFTSVYYATKDSLGNWNLTLIDSIGTGPDVDTDSMDYPRVVYNSNYGGILRHAYWNGSAWIKEDISEDYGHITLKIDKLNNPHISLGAPIILNQNRLGWVG